MRSIEASRASRPGPRPGECTHPSASARANGATPPHTTPPTPPYHTPHAVPCHVGGGGERSHSARGKGGRDRSKPIGGSMGEPDRAARAWEGDPLAPTRAKAAAHVCGGGGSPPPLPAAAVGASRHLTISLSLVRADGVGAAPPAPAACRPRAHSPLPLPLPPREPTVNVRACAPASGYVPLLLFGCHRRMDPSKFLRRVPIHPRQPAGCS